MSITMQFDRRTAQARFDRAADNILSGLAFTSAHVIQDHAPRDTGFLSDSVRALPVGNHGYPGSSELRGGTVRVAQPAPAPDRGSSAVHVGADYAVHVALMQDFIVGPAYQAGIRAIADLCARYRLT
jgi:hypothetical protein